MFRTLCLAEASTRNEKRKLRLGNPVLGLAPGLDGRASERARQKAYDHDQSSRRIPNTLADRSRHVIFKAAIYCCSSKLKAKLFV
jgi:hypothetical protein